MEARGNAESALVRLHQMALTIGQQVGLFNGLGTYENGDFDHEFEAREAIPVDEAEKWETIAAVCDQKPPLAWVLKRMGYSDEMIAEMQAAKAEELQTQANIGGELLRQFESGGNTGFTPGQRQPVAGSNGNNAANAPTR
jgi:hypothetical protein